MESARGVSTRACVKCGKSLREDANVCPECGHDYRPVMMGRAWEGEETPLPPIGGALIALSGVSQVLAGLLWISGFMFEAQADGYHNEAVVTSTGLAIIITGFFAIFVSPFAMTRRRLVLSLAGGLAAVVGGGIAVILSVAVAIGSIGLIGVLLIALARDEFVD